VEHDMPPEKPTRASPNSRLVEERELGVEAQKVVDLAAAGPKTFMKPSLKRKAPIPLDVPRYRRGFVWTNLDHDCISPAALFTETAAPLPSPPPHLLENPAIQSSLQAMKDHIKVDTPFNVDRLTALLFDHPNQPFVSSVMRGLREGFWPFDESEWKIEERIFAENFASEDEDLAAIRAFRDKELAAGRWSSAIPNSTLLPGMKMSPMFVAWQKDKARVITDHTASGLNDGIPRSEAKVRYDDMHPFGQILYNAIRTTPNRRLVVFKSDVASAFLNLPAHPLWQLRQIVTVDEALHIVRRLVFGNRASPRIWCAVSGLLCWISIQITLKSWLIFSMWLGHEAVRSYCP